MSGAAEQLAQALRDLIDEAVQAAVDRERPTPTRAQVVERSEVPAEDSGLCPWCNRKHMRHLMPVKQPGSSSAGSAPPPSTA